MINRVIIRHLGLQAYLPIWQAMQKFTDQRHQDTVDEIWVLEHSAIFTQGQNGNPEHLLNAENIPVLKVDRGGQITYHGPGQLIAYTLVDLQRKKWTVRHMVCALEQSIIESLQSLQIHAERKKDAPGVYIEQKKIASVGLRIRRGCSFHGLAFNIDMDLKPFTQINPCGFTGLKMTQLSEHCSIDIKLFSQQFIEYLSNNLGYTEVEFC